jgi:hypothetical protein
MSEPIPNSLIQEVVERATEITQPTGDLDICQAVMEGLMERKCVVLADTGQTWTVGWLDKDLKDFC